LQKRFEIQPKGDVSPYLRGLTPILALASSLAITTIIMMYLHVNVREAYGLLIYGAVGNVTSLSETLLKCSTLLAIAVGLSVAFRASFYNIGADGQFIFGGIGATWVALSLPNLPAVILIPLMILFGVIFGGLFALVAGMLKAYLNVNEIIVTILANFVAVYFLEYLLYYNWKDPAALYPQTLILSVNAQLPNMIPGTRLHVGVVLPFLLALVFYFLLWHTRIGYNIRVVGHNIRAARYSGISIAKTVVLTSLLTGGMSGLAGMMEISGVQHFLLLGFSGSSLAGYGYLAIVVALLAKLNPLYCIPAALGFAGLLNGAQFMEQAGISIGIITFLEALMILTLLIFEFFVNYRVVVR
jgi:ABC-type uncharacterized transport system permease subunit